MFSLERSMNSKGRWHEYWKRLYAVTSYLLCTASVCAHRYVHLCSRTLPYIYVQLTKSSILLNQQKCTILFGQVQALCLLSPATTMYKMPYYNRPATDVYSTLSRHKVAASHSRKIHSTSSKWHFDCNTANALSITARIMTSFSGEIYTPLSGDSEIRRPSDHR